MKIQHNSALYKHRQFNSPEIPGKKIKRVFHRDLSDRVEISHEARESYRLEKNHKSTKEISHERADSAHGAAMITDEMIEGAAENLMVFLLGEDVSID